MKTTIEFDARESGEVLFSSRDRQLMSCMMAVELLFYEGFGFLRGFGIFVEGGD